MSDKAKKGLKIIVRGVVQGVGFRYFVFNLAKQMGLSGFTQNLPDGSVEILVCGNSSLIEQFVKDVKVGPRHGQVSAVETSIVEIDKTYDSFEIKGW